MRFVVACIASLVVYPHVVHSADYRLFLKQSSILYSETARIRLFEDDLENLRDDKMPDAGNHVLTFNRAEVGAGWRNWEIGFFMRQDYLFDFTEDTFDFIYRDKNDLPIPQDKIYDVYLKAQHIEAEGLRLGYVLPFSRGSLTTSFNYFKADKLLYGDIAGQAGFDGDDINRGRLNLFYYYHEDYLFDNPVANPATGEGYSIDLAADVKLTETTHLKLQFHDILGRIYWRDAPFTRARAASQQTYYDEQGYAHREPTVRSLSYWQNFNQPLPLHYEVALQQDLIWGFSLTYNREQFDQVVFDRLFLNYHPLNNLTLTSGYDFTAEAVWFAVHSPWLSLDFATDDLSLVDSKALVLRMSAQARF